MSTLLTVIHVITCIFLMLTVLLQDGKSGMGGAFGGGNATTMFGGSGASSFLRKLTAGAATMFMLTSIVLAFLASHNSADSLEKFGENQAKLAADKEAAKAKALQDAGKGSGAGSGSAGSAAPAGISVMGPDGKPMPNITITPGPTPANGSPTNGSAAPTAGSAAPAEAPIPTQPSMGEPRPAGTGSAAPAGTKAATDKASAPAAGSAAATPAVIEKKPVTGTASPVNPQPSSGAAPQTSNKPTAPSTP